MANLPKQITLRNDIDCRLGIKSSLGDIPSVISLAYLLYCANDKKSQIEYADEQIQYNGKKKLILKKIYKDWIINNLSLDDSILDSNPLLTSQLESLQVGLGLMFKIAKISYVDYPNSDTKERTGGERFKKLIKFAVNIKIIDIYISAWDKDIVKSELSLWLQNKPSQSTLSNGLKQILTSFSEETQFKLRNNSNEIIFQQEGIYKSISKNENIIAKDEQEDVGPFRIFKSFVREGIHPFLALSNNEFLLKNNNEFEAYKDLVETTLSLSPKRIVIFQEVKKENDANNSESPDSHQIIYYGAPGTGKSHKIKTEKLMGVPSENIFRTTFHPDSDYSTFVGSFKPTMKKQYRYNGQVKAKYYEDDDLANAKKDDPMIDNIIEYQFIPQSFLQAYIQAYKKPNENVFLVIEEINRGNCAQIFGDLFQLLDRNEDGKSDYTIKADTDLKNFLIDELGKDNDGIKNGELCLPYNLYILATMNTSDQSLFPIDSAFKRRWDWEYEPIKYKNTDWLIEIDGIKYSWVKFQKEVNRRILKDTGSEDKMMGDYFVNPHNSIISKKLFLNKILFYLWNDVCKDGDSDIFPSDNDFSFSKLYDDDSSETIHSMMKNLVIEPEGNEIETTIYGKSDSDDVKNEKNTIDSGFTGVILDGNRFPVTTSKFDLYIDIIKKIGIEKIGPIVEDSKYRRKNRPLISKIQFPEILESNEYSYVKINQYNVVKGIDDNTKINILELIKDKLNLDLKIETDN